MRRRNRYNTNLSRGQPEGPVSTEILRQDGNHTLDATQHGPVDNDWTVDFTLLNLGPNGFQLCVALGYRNVRHVG
jgi:hypothetical protein